MINLSEKIFVAYNPATSKKLGEAVVSPVGNTTAEKRKIEKLQKDYKVCKEYLNIPLPGFTLLANSKKSYGSIDSTWLMIDPRGFVVRITNANLVSIMLNSSITHGLIQEKCVWIRNDNNSTMELVPVSSPIYQEAVENTDILSKKVNLQEVNIGDRVFLQSGITGKYLGRMSLYLGISTNGEQTYSVEKSIRRQVAEIEPGKILHMSDLKILRVEEKSDKAMTIDDAVDYVNNLISQGNVHFSTFPNYFPSSSSGINIFRNDIRLCSKHAEKDVNFTFESITQQEAEKIFSTINMNLDIGQLLLEDHNGKHFLIDFDYFLRSNTPSNKFKVFQVKVDMQNPIPQIIGLSPRTTRAYYTKNINPNKDYSISDFDKFYRIAKNVRDKKYY